MIEAIGIGVFSAKSLSLRRPVLALACLLPLAVGAADAKDRFGSLAIDENQGNQWGWAVGYPDALAADDRALRECGKSCGVVLRFHNTCAAYAAGQQRKGLRAAFALKCIRKPTKALDLAG